MRNSLIIFASLLALGSASAHAAQSPKGTHKGPAAPAAAPVWTVDKAASLITFKATANNVGFDGRIKTWDAQIAFDPKNLKASHAMVTLVMSSVVTGDPTRDQMLPTGDWFDVGKFGKATFDSSNIVQTSPDHYVANGTLTLHGVKRPVALPFTLTIAKDNAKMDGAVTLNRMDFGVGKGQAGGPETVAPQVAVSVRLVAHKGH
jgi:polyisoprenoid-binding protein YceI